MYAYNRLNLFYTHDEDSFGAYQKVLNFTELGELKYEETKFATGVMLNSHNTAFTSVFESSEELSQYVRVYSAQVSYSPT
jgi:hypothetical protein